MNRDFTSSYKNDNGTTISGGAAQSRKIKEYGGIDKIVEDANNEGFDDGYDEGFDNGYNERISEEMTAGIIGIAGLSLFAAGAFLYRKMKELIVKKKQNKTQNEEIKNNEREDQSIIE